MKLLCVAPHLIDNIYPMVEKMIDDGYAVGDEFVPGDLLHKLHDGHACLWIAVEPNGAIVAAMISEIILRRSGKALRMTSASGIRMREWKHLCAEIEEYAKREGCVKVFLGGRFGWRRVLDGYRPVRVTLEKRIEP